MVQTQRRLAFPVMEAARRLGMTRMTLYRDIKAGKLTAYKVGATTIIYQDDFNEYVLRWRGGRGIETP